MASILDFLKIASPYVSAGGQVASAIGANRAQGRAAEAVANSNYDQTAMQRYQAEQNARLGAAQLTENATQDRADRQLTNSRDRAQQVGLGDLLANVQDVEVEGMPDYIPRISFSGGLRPSALGGMTRQAGGNLARDALTAQMTGSDIPDLPNVSGIGGDAPALSEMPEAGKLDKIMEVLGYAGLPAQIYEERKRRRQEEERQAARQRPYTTPATVPTNLAGSGLFGTPSS